MTAARFLLAAGLAFSFATPASAFCLCLKCASAEWESFQAASGSMKPALEPDACLIVQHGAKSERGDIIAFRHPVKPENTFIFRLTGLPGDTVQMTDGQVILNGAALPQTAVAPYQQLMQPEGATRNTPLCPDPTAAGETCSIPRFTETVPESAAYDILNLKPDGLGDFMTEITVPSGHVFVLGDNRDNALDSRIGLEKGGPGFIPVENILGPVVEFSTT